MLSNSTCYTFQSAVSRLWCVLPKFRFKTKSFLYLFNFLKSDYEVEISEVEFSVPDYCDCVVIFIFVLVGLKGACMLNFSFLGSFSRGRPGGSWISEKLRLTQPSLAESGPTLAINWEKGIWWNLKVIINTPSPSLVSALRTWSDEEIVIYFVSYWQFNKYFEYIY